MWEHIRQPTGIWTVCQEPHPWRKWLSHPQQPLYMANSFGGRVGLRVPLPINAEILPDLILHEFCACSHRSYEFMCATSFSCPENIVLQESPKYHYPLQYFWAPFILFLSLRMRSMVTWVKCSTVFYSLYFAKSWIYILLAIHAKIGFPLETCTSQWLYR